MLTKIIRKINDMNKIAYRIMYFGLIIACILMIAGTVLHQTGTELYHNMSEDLGKTAVSIFAESVIGAIFIDYFSKSYKK